MVAEDIQLNEWTPAPMRLVSAKQPWPIPSVDFSYNCRNTANVLPHTPWDLVPCTDFPSLKRHTKRVLLCGRTLREHEKSFLSLSGTSSTEPVCTTRLKLPIHTLIPQTCQSFLVQLVHKPHEGTAALMPLCSGRQPLHIANLYFPVSMAHKSMCCSSSLNNNSMQAVQMAWKPHRTCSP